MRYLDVFKVWFFADLILALGVFVGGVVFGHNEDAAIMGMVIGYGLGVSLPSLVCLMIFNAWYKRSGLLADKVVVYFCGAIIVINIIYAIVSAYFFTMGAEFNLFFLATTVAGLISFWIVYAFAKKRAIQQ
jgi:hypothetical protein